MLPQLGTPLWSRFAPRNAGKQTLFPSHRWEILGNLFTRQKILCTWNKLLGGAPVGLGGGSAPGVKSTDSSQVCLTW